MRFILGLFILAFSTLPVHAASLTPAQIQQLKQQQSELAKIKPSLIAALTESTSKCNALSDAIATSSSKQQAVDQKFSGIQNIAAASKLLPLGTQAQSGLKALASSGAAIKLGCADRSKQADSLSRELDAAIADLGNSIQQAEHDPTQSSALASKVDHLKTQIAALKAITDGQSNTIIQAKEPASTVQGSIQKFKLEYAKTSTDILEEQQRIKDMMDSLDDVNQDLQLQIQKAVDAMTKAAAAASEQAKKFSSAIDAIIGNIKG